MLGDASDPAISKDNLLDGRKEALQHSAFLLARQTNLRNPVRMQDSSIRWAVGRWIKSRRTQDSYTLEGRNMNSTLKFHSEDQQCSHMVYYLSYFYPFFRQTVKSFEDLHENSDPTFMLHLIWISRQCII